MSVKYTEYLKSDGAAFIWVPIVYDTSKTIRAIIDLKAESGYLGWDGGGYVGVNNGKWYMGSVIDMQPTERTTVEITITGTQSSFKFTQGGNVKTSSRSNSVSANSGANGFPLFGITVKGGGIESTDRMIGTLYSAKFYENGALKYDLAPCVNQVGTPCLYDKVSSTYLKNSGGGSFTAGPSLAGVQTTLVNGTEYEVFGGKCLVNGVAYSIKKGRTLIGGTGYDITLPGVGTRVSTLRVGQSVYAKVNGAAKEFIVVHQGKPSSLYDESCNGTWLLMKDIYETRQWDSSNVNNLENSTIHAYLNNTFLSLFDSNIKDVIKQVKIPYRKNGGPGGSNQSGANGLPAKIFLLSGYEVGWTISGLPLDGAKLDYFEAGTGTSANNKRVANLKSSPFGWWLRSPDTSLTNGVWHVDPNGSFVGDNNAINLYGIRPALILRSDALVDDEFNIIS